MGLQIQSVMVSIDASDKEFGRGTGSFVQLRGSYPDPVDIEYLDDVVMDSLDMFLAAWKSLLMAKYAQSGLPGDKMKEQFDLAMKKTAKVKDYFRRLNEEGPATA